MELDKFIIGENSTIEDALIAINNNGKGIVFVCDNENKLIASISDGDIRRALIESANTKTKISKVWNKQVAYIKEGASIEEKEKVDNSPLDATPFLNNKHEIIKIKFKNNEEIVKKENHKTEVVIMAGGKGTRLKPYTDVLPKPIIPVGNKTITELIIDSFSKFGYRKFNMVLNYKGNLVKTYFEEIKSENEISYYFEKTFLGTIGGIKGLEKDLTRTFILTNCDVLVDVDYNHVLRTHREEGNKITVVCAKKTLEISYGAVNINKDNSISEIVEKPNYEILVNAGVYVIEPEVFNYIKENTFMHTTDIISMYLNKNERVGAYLVDESCWMDMGQLDEFEKMKKEVETRGW